MEVIYRFCLFHYIWRGDFTEGFLCYRLGGLYLEGLIFGILRYDYVTIFANTTSVMLKMHGQYGTKTRGTRLKNGESGKVFSREKRGRN